MLKPRSFQPELRHEPRASIREAASLHVFNPLVAGCSGVTAADRSADGLQIISPCPISIGALVQVRLANALVFGQVRHCAAAAGGFRIGVLIENSMPLKLKSSPESSGKTDTAARSAYASVKGGWL
jgi:hypothetical protein